MASLCSSHLNPKIWHITLAIKFWCQRVSGNGECENRTWKPRVLFLSFSCKVNDYSLVFTLASARRWRLCVVCDTVYHCVEITATVSCWLPLAPSSDLPFAISSTRSTCIGYSFPLKMEAVGSSKASISVYQTAWCNVPEDGSGDSHHFGILICQEERYITNKQPFWEIILQKLVQYYE